MLDFDHIPHLLPAQIDYCYAAAVERVKKYNGERPDIKRFSRQKKEELGSLFQPVDAIMFLLFIVLFVFSLLHLITWAQREAIASYLHSTSELIESASAVDTSGSIQISLDRFGLTISQSLYVLLHQASILGFSELGLIFLSIVHVNSRKTSQKQGKSNGVVRFFHHYISVYSVLALLVAVVIFAANVSSQFNPLVAMLVPATTIVISERLSALFALKLERDSLIISNFREKSSEWESVNDEPEKSSKFKKFFAEAILAYYKQNIFPKREELRALNLNRREELHLSAREIHRSLVNDDDLNLAISSFQ